jgi:1-aminocyclopropane-1-carboxylate deaminase/D-cysteine desulfhydrase-like pyridoxal-dependent ACC family enzyme
VTHIFPTLDTINLSHWDHVIFREHNLQVDVLRLDQLHPVVSGNKWFKLKYYLERAKHEEKSKLVSFGGAYSNHLIALAEASRWYGFSSAAFIRGEEADKLSYTLQEAREMGMELHFLSRRDYDEKKKSVFSPQYENHESRELLIPEGGAGWEGVKGAAEILSLIPAMSYAYICCAVGTGTTLTGLINHSGPKQKVIGVSVLRGTRGIEPVQHSWLLRSASLENVHMIHQDHFGGYAKKSSILFDFMNRLFSESDIPTDFVYTGKLFYSIVRLASENFFQAGSRILVLHSGGLQGNRSLAPGLLLY